jgi:hypothetical protein
VALAAHCRDLPLHEKTSRDENADGRQGPTNSRRLYACKLAAIVQPGSKYIFVNRRGMKVAERSRMALAVELKRKSITILDESQVFDRALEAVIGNLRQLHRKPN